MPATEEMKQIAEPFGSWFFSSSRSIRWRWPMKLIFIRSVVPSATPAAENTAWMGPLDLLERGVDRGGVAQVDLDRLGDVVVHRRVVQHDDFGAEFGGRLGGRRAHAGRTADNERALTVVAQPIDNRHGNPLLN